MASMNEASGSIGQNADAAAINSLGDGADQFDNGAEESEIGGPASDAGFSEESAKAQEDDKKIKLEKAKTKEANADAAEAIRSSGPDLIERARQLSSQSHIVLPEFVQRGEYAILNKDSDINRWGVMDALFGESGGPHVDLFRGRIVDHEGELVDDHYSFVTLTKAMRAAGLTGQSASSIKSAFFQWAKNRKWDDMKLRLTARIASKPWDGVKRLEGSLINLFESFPTEENKAMGRYFWLSLAARLLYPGRMAPIALSLFGSQNCGKSYFSKVICEEIMNDEGAHPVDIDFGVSDMTNFLREITGVSPIANCGEMTGFTRSDVNRVKGFMTRTNDPMNYKYEGNFEQMRRWIVVMDGNKYEGLQRDDTGNRRFMPLFVMQLEPDADGTPSWKGRDDPGATFKIDFSTFRDDIWKYLAEAKAWLDSHTANEYHKMVDATSALVKEFNAEEMRAGRGGVRDPILETYFSKAMSKVDFKARNEGKAKVRGKEISVGAGWSVYVDDLTDEIRKVAGNMKVNADAVKRYMAALMPASKGWIEGRLNGGRRGFLYEDREKDGQPLARPDENTMKKMLLGEDVELF